MEPFTTEEEASLVGRLDTLSVSSLESYIGSAKNSLGNHSLALTWRPRIEFALRHAELALVKAVAAAALVEAAPAAVVEAPAPKSRSKSKKAIAADASADADVDADADAAV